MPRFHRSVPRHSNRALVDPEPAALFPTLRTVAILGLVALALVPGSGAFAAPGDTTWVRTFDQDFYNWATPHYDTFTLPDDPALYEQIVAFYTIACPSAPNDCDPWDRLGHLRVVTPDGDVEIARIITPYDITGGDRPGSCTWQINVSAYKSILRGTVELRNYIESWIGGNNGWLVTVDFAFIEGERAFEPYKVVNLWQNDYVVYGDPAQPTADAIPPVSVPVDENVDKVKVRVFATGHGQGNTANCAEFCPMTHRVVTEGTEFSHTLWNTNCGSNPCSPQGGNWTFGRAGWCPGMQSNAWVVDVTNAVVPGQSALFDYVIEDYENLCRPNNPECVPGVTCTDCNYNSTGHTQPHYTIQGQVVFYRARANVVGVDGAFEDASGRGLSLGQSAPNPAREHTTIAYTIYRPSPVTLTIHDAAGRLIREVRRGHPAPGEYTYRWDGRDAGGRAVAAGAYFYRVEAAGEVQSRKVVIVK